MKKILLLAMFGIFSIAAPAQMMQLVNSSQTNVQSNTEQDVFTPIGKYIQSGDYDKLSAWFADNLELNILGCHQQLYPQSGTSDHQELFYQLYP